MLCRALGRIARRTTTQRKKTRRISRKQSKGTRSRTRSRNREQQDRCYGIHIISMMHYLRMALQQWQNQGLYNGSGDMIRKYTMGKTNPHTTKTPVTNSILIRKCLAPSSQPRSRKKWENAIPKRTSSPTHHHHDAIVTCASPLPQVFLHNLPSTQHCNNPFYLSPSLSFSFLASFET